MQRKMRNADRPTPSAPKLSHATGQAPVTCFGRSLVSKRADAIGEAFSARNRQIFAALARAIFDAFETGRTVGELCREYGLPAERIGDILADEKRSRIAKRNDRLSGRAGTAASR
jgi:hypothetical protein